ncbi:MAG: DUF933 domain-containing protein [Dehalococcoidia bacterium]|nr:DUF933 domain-containing protein [Dehalococcoidia bacterium]
MQMAIIGLARSGKTTLFNALTHGHAPVGAFDGEAELHIGTYKVPDERLDRLAPVFKAKKVTHADIQYVDVPGGLAWRGGRGGGPSPQVQAALDRSESLVHVVRAFRNEAVPHPEGSVDPQRDIDTLDLELAFSDLGVIERRLERLDTAVRSARAGEREAGEHEMALLRRIKEGLEAGTPIRAQPLTKEELRSVANYNFLTAKPLLILLNIDEADVPQAAAIEEEARARRSGPSTAVAAACGTLEMELIDLSDEEEREFRADLGLGEAAAERISRLSFHLLDLIFFFTGNEDECRAWTVPRDTPAPRAAGKVHSDMERGFIRAEVIRWDELISYGSLAEARRHGALRGEGKGYHVQDGDVLHILFNV